MKSFSGTSRQLKHLYWKFRFALEGFTYIPFEGGATITKPFTFSAGATIIAADHNSNFDTIYNDYNGNITNANLSASAAIVDTKLAQITTQAKVTLGALTVASQAQGDVIYASSATVWTRLGAGTAGQALTTGGAAANPAWAGMTTQGDVEYHNGTTRTRLGPGTSGQFLKTQGAGANPLWATVSGLSVKVGSSTRVGSTASGTVTISGLGFTPKLVLIQYCNNAGVDDNAGWGFSDATTQGGVFTPDSTPTSGKYEGATSAIVYYETAANKNVCSINNFVSGAFDMVWTKTGSPTDTILFQYAAIG